MSQAENAAATSSTKLKRAYRKGNPLSSAEKKRLSVSRKKETHKVINLQILNERKDELQFICQKEGMTQAEVVQMLINQYYLHQILEGE